MKHSLQHLDDLSTLIDSHAVSQNNLEKYHRNFSRLLTALEHKPLTAEDIEFVNNVVKKLNEPAENEKVLLKKLKPAHRKVLTYFDKTHQWVAINHYRSMWLALGIGAFGVPMGVAFSMSLNNMAFIGIGIPIGLAMGLAIGTGLDKQAKEKGRQLDYEPRL